MLFLNSQLTVGMWLVQVFSIGITLKNFHLKWQNRYSSSSYCRSTRYFNNLHSFSITVPRCIFSMHSTFFPRTAEIWNYLPAEWKLLIYDLNSLKSRVNRHALYLCSFYRAFLYAFLRLLFLVIPFLVKTVNPCEEWKKKVTRFKIKIAHD